MNFDSACELGLKDTEPMAVQKNWYFVLSDSGKQWLEVDISAPDTLGWGRDFYVDTFLEIERNHDLKGLVIYIAYQPPPSLPILGANVVLVIVGDEFYQHRAYFSQIGGILRCYGQAPVYLDHYLMSKLSRAAMFGFAHKWAGHAASALTVAKTNGHLGLRNARRKTLHIPLGSFARFEPQPKPMSERSLDYAFLGSVAFAQGQVKLIHKLLTSPKVLSRNQMMTAISKLAQKHTGKLHSTNDFEDSIANHDNYVATMADTKISLVPRGTNYETYRFFESCKAGCVIICDPLPDEWCYQGHPGIVIRDWAQLPKIVSALLKDPATLEEKSAQALAYWHDRASEAAVARYIVDFIKTTIPHSAGNPQPYAASEGGADAAVASAALSP